MTSIYNWLKTKRGCRKLYLLLRHLKHCWQYLTRGFSDRQLWSLDVTIASYVLPRLKRYKEINNGYPLRAEKDRSYTEEEWNTVLDDMIYAMQYVVDGKIYIPSNVKEFDAEGFDRHQHGIELFAKHFHNLWL